MTRSSAPRTGAKVRSAGKVNPLRWRARPAGMRTTSPPPTNNFDVVPLVRSYEPMKDIRREIEQRTSGAPASGGATVPAGATQVGV